MKEVACTVVAAVVAEAVKKGHSPDALARASGYPLEHLKNKHERIEWDAFLRILAALREGGFKDADFEEIGHNFFNSPVMRYVRAVARTLFDAPAFFGWVFAKSGAGVSTFSHVVPKLTTREPLRLELEMRLQEGYLAARDFFLICKGSYEQMPVVLGLRRADVEMTLRPDGAVYDVRLPEGGGYLAKVKRALFYPFEGRAAALELKDAHAVLKARYDELETARRELERYAAELVAVNRELEARVEERTKDLKATAAELARSLEKQKELDRAKTEFFSNAQHELRTPLTLLLSPVETLSADERIPAAARQELKSALRNGYRLLKLVNDVLDLSKVEAGRLQLRTCAVDLVQLVRDVSRSFDRPLAARNVSFRLELPPTMSGVVDPERIEQVLLNLLSNAARFANEGGAVTVGAARTDGHCRIYVENTGEQLDEEQLQKLFGRFEQATNSPARRHGTSGLGLAVVKEIVQLHGGMVSGENVPGGVRFTVSLPSFADAQVAADPLGQPSSAMLRQYDTLGDAQAQADDAAPGSETRPLLLVAEDNADLRAYLTGHLRSEYAVIEADSGTRALALARERLPELILSDLMMPEMDGLQLCAELKGDPRTQAIPFVLLTARSDLGAKLSGLEKGADDYLIKPFHLEEVRARLRTQLRLRRLSRQVAHREKLAALGTLVAGVAHEMRNPLNGIINSLRPMRELIPADDAAARELLDIAIESCTQIDRVSGQLLRQAHPGEWNRAEVDLCDNLQLAVSLMRHKTVGGPALTLQAPEEQPLSVIGDSGALTQVWINLVDNAIRAAGPNGKVSVSARVEGAWAIVEVADDGPGIPPEIAARIFDPFFTTREPGEGTGLGLSVGREVVTAHGGTIGVDSTPGRGARFRVTLPLAEAHQGEVCAP